MKLTLQLTITIILVLFSCSSIAAQVSRTTHSSLVLEQGVTPHKGLDETYRRFSEGYKKLDASTVANLYSETAAYLAPGNKIQIGRSTILETFNTFFDLVKRGNGKLEISFRIVQRQTHKNLAYDIGVYTLTSTNEKGIENKDSGKFVVVAKREKRCLAFSGR